MKYISRACEENIKKQQRMFKVILVTGARQVGKTTMLKNLKPDLAYVTLDDILENQQAVDDPELFLKVHTPPVVIDEIQYAPDLLRYIKILVDNTDKMALFFLTGSQQFHLMKNASESLAGRVGIVNLLGLSLREISGTTFRDPFLPTADFFSRRKNHIQPLSYKTLWKIIQQGQMPALQDKTVDPNLFYASYLSTYIERDVRNLTQVGDTMDFLKFTTALASRVGQLLNLTNIASEIGISTMTAKRWLAILEASNIVFLLEPYHNNLMKRMIKTPKVYFYDTGLAAYLARWRTPETLEAGVASGNFFENFVITEILKSYYNAGELHPPLSFYRDKDQTEIDLIIEGGDTLYPIEIKKTAKPTKDMVKNFAVLANAGKKIGDGAVVCAREDILQLDNRNIALPFFYL